MIYEYVIDAAARFGTANNRLMKFGTVDTSAGCDPQVSSCPLISTDYYIYNFAGNVARVVSESASPTAGEPRFNATRYVYARNAQTVSYVLGETWNPDGPDPDPDPDDYTVTFAREFRYDSARARYLDRQLDPAGLMATPQTFDVLSETWTNYDGKNTYGDFAVLSGAVTEGTGYELGLAQINRPTLSTFDTLYAHNDHLGTLHAQSNASGFTSYPVHTAFGGDRTSLGLRYSYVCAHGYQSNDNFDSLHVGARYYDPSSGRFLQRDPIGIRGGINLYAYVRNSPLTLIDPSGLNVIGDALKTTGSGFMATGSVVWAFSALMSPTGPAAAVVALYGTTAVVVGGVGWTIGAVLNWLF